METTDYDHDTPVRHYVDGRLSVLARYAIPLGDNGKTADACCRLYIAPTDDGQTELAYITTNGDPIILAWRAIADGDVDMDMADDALEHWPWAVQALRDELLLDD